jgi:hypothetical protein
MNISQPFRLAEKITQANSVDSSLEKISFASVGIAIVGLISYSSKIPTLIQVRSSRCGRFTNASNVSQTVVRLGGSSINRRHGRQIHPTRAHASRGIARNTSPRASPPIKIMTTESPFVPKQHPVHYKTIRVNELDIFYREAGPQSAPTILLLHGFPTSSNMFRNLIPRLATSFHVVAPDYPGFGQSSMPSHKDFSYTFENLTSL